MQSIPLEPLDRSTITPEHRTLRAPIVRPTLRITELASRLGTTTRALRYYEEKGLVTVSRTPGGSRYYGPDCVDRLRLVIALRRANLPMADIHEVMDAEPKIQQEILINRLKDLDHERILLLKTIGDLTSKVRA